jgi:hypothetical protein
VILRHCIIPDGDPFGRRLIEVSAIALDREDMGSGSTALPGNYKVTATLAGQTRLNNRGSWLRPASENLKTDPAGLHIQDLVLLRLRLDAGLARNVHQEVTWEVADRVKPGEEPVLLSA